MKWKERPLLFSAPMVLALLAGTKTQTRRVVKMDSVSKFHGGDLASARVDGAFVGNLFSGPKEQYLRVDCSDHTSQRLYCPHGKPTDRLWVKETSRPRSWDETSVMMEYRADGAMLERSPPNMEDWVFGKAEPAARERGWEHHHGMWLQTNRPMKWTPSIFMPRWASRITLDITEVRVQRLQDISEEDARAEGVFREDEITGGWAKLAYAKLWDSINGEDSWFQNPWVWALTFKVVQP